MTTNTTIAQEDADDTQELRRVAIDPLSRVEGHGKVTLLLDEQNHVRQARLHIVEFRGFEKFIEGRPYWEAPVMVQRLCGICPVSHHLAAAKALDMALGQRLTPTAEKNRRLMHYGQVLQSHALHFYHLCTPDLLFGFDSDVARRNIVGIIGEYPEIATQGVLLRKYGQEMIHVTAGKKVHGTGAIPGGMNKAISESDRRRLRTQFTERLDWAQGALALIEKLHSSNKALYDGFGNIPAKTMSLVAPDGAMDLYHGDLRCRDEAGELIFDQADYRKYQELIHEEVKSWSYMKFPYLVQAGRAEGWYRVGPLARVQNCDYIPTRLAEEARQNFIRHGGGQIQHGALANHWARMIEMLHALESIGLLLQDDEISQGEIHSSDPLIEGVRMGIGMIEAPRGTLIHEYEIGDDDLITRCNLIVSTTHNNQVMNESVRAVADRYFDGREVSEGLLNHIEVAIRAYDPCLSCATHALGKMPLIVEALDTEGRCLSRRVKEA